MFPRATYMYVCVYVIMYAYLYIYIYIYMHADMAGWMDGWMASWTVWACWNFVLADVHVHGQRCIAHRHSLLSICAAKAHMRKWVSYL